MGGWTHRNARTNPRDLPERNLTCHEVGHSVGFRDGGYNGTSFMTGGNNAVLNEFERLQIDGPH
jgi:6-phosphogluconate dehydrogenase (decarboxylating)